MHKVGNLRMRMFDYEHGDYGKIQVEQYNSSANNESQGYINFCLIEYDIGTAKYRGGSLITYMLTILGLY